MTILFYKSQNNKKEGLNPNNFEINKLYLNSKEKNFLKISFEFTYEFCGRLYLILTINIYDNIYFINILHKY